MKKLIVVRHGHAPGTDLSDLGEEQVRTLGARLRRFLEKSTTVIATSDSVRAKETGTIIAEILDLPEPLEGCTLESGKYLLSIPPLRQKILNFVGELGVGVDVVILVSHQGTVQPIVQLFTEELGIQCNETIFSKEIDPASGYMIDLEAKRIALV